ncbi:hypothetical protein C8R46DRAFT_612943 [Mycena filopes]|nr:hypothetical protein C8R46DRAFT_612943 [Mycena filopes]
MILKITERTTTASAPAHRALEASCYTAEGTRVAAYYGDTDKVSSSDVQWPPRRNERPSDEEASSLSLVLRLRGRREPPARRRSPASAGSRCLAFTSTCSVFFPTSFACLACLTPRYLQGDVDECQGAPRSLCIRDVPTGIWGPRAPEERLSTTSRRMASKLTRTRTSARARTTTRRPRRPSSRAWTSPSSITSGEQARRRVRFRDPAPAASDARGSPRRPMDGAVAL